MLAVLIDSGRRTGTFLYDKDDAVDQKIVGVEGVRYEWNSAMNGMKLD